MTSDGRPEHLKRVDNAALGAKRFQETHERILAAVRSLLTTYEASQITLLMIQREARIARVTLNRHFTSAQQAVDAAIQS